MADLRFWKIDECAVYHGQLHLRGWCHVPGARITKVEAVFPDGVAFPLHTFGLASPDVDAFCGPGAAHARFDERLPMPPSLVGRSFVLQCWLADGTCAIGHDALTNAAWGDEYFQSWESFLGMLQSCPAGKVLEVGSRARSAITRRHRIPAHLEYVGIDIVAGENVDIVADAHSLSEVFRTDSFVAAFSTSVFEHLAMPWKVVLELNRVLHLGGIVYTASHQTFPIHEEPWDFWRYAPNSWRCLFNEFTGFELLQTAVGEPARVYPCRTSEVTRDLHLSPAWLGSACIARKRSGTSLSWPVPLHAATAADYPAATVATPPTKDPV